MSDSLQIPKNKPQDNQMNQNLQGNKNMSMAGKTINEMLPYLLSGESDDLSIDNEIDMSTIE